MINRRAALVLAGGKACRFQTLHQPVWQDKALVLLEGKPLLVWVIGNVVDIVDEVVVCVNTEERKVRYLEILEKHSLNDVKVIVDEKTKINGPNVAILSGLNIAQADFCMVIPCDMPFVKPEVINYLFEMATRGFDVVVPMWPNGVLETLIMVLKRTIGLEIVRTLCQLKRDRPSDIPRAAAKTLLISPLKTINKLDPTLKSFININTQEDLTKLQTRNLQGVIQQNITLNRGHFLISDLQLLCDAVKKYQKDNFLEAKEKIDLSHSRFESCGNFFWAALASESKGKILLKHHHQQQLQKNEKDSNSNYQTVFAFDFEYKKVFSNAASNYYHEAELYKKHQCTRLLERAIADNHNMLTLIT
ncbi:MAG: molybdenum cofactor guanylyltransferase [Candidatus Bathyarchaeota archaeon]|nr:molybdenum cofactor guanylyltransferase [Candidatus Termiticorpusculum sp.]